MQLLNLISRTGSLALTPQVFAVSAMGAQVDISGCNTVALDAVLTNSTPSNKTFTDTSVNVAADTITITANAYATGLAVTLTSTGTLPAGLSTSTTYYVISVDANTFKLATSRANALAGTAINITDQGTVAATNTVVVTALAGTIVLQGSTGAVNQPQSTWNWTDLNSAQSFSANTSFLFGLTLPQVKHLAINVVITTGQASITQSVLGKGIA